MAAFAIPVCKLKTLKTRISVYLVNFKKYRYLLQDLVLRDIKIKYRRSILGIVWSVLNPLLMMLVTTAVFQNLFRFNIKNFPIYYLTGILIFNFVAEATSGAMVSVIGAGALIRKVYIPKYIFPLEKCLFAFVNMAFSLIATVIMLLILQVDISWTILLFWVPLVYALIFSVGLGLILASFNVFFRDIGHLYSVWTTAWMYLTPIIYPMEILNDTFILPIVKLNPLYFFVDYFRQVVMYGTLPSLYSNMMCLIYSMVFLILGLLVFKKKQDRFILYI
ncbi:MAG TPA: ABC transporter permease [Firmicutes bacterium]|nr:ABC transporter permease [Bacillota bacterium]